MSSSTLKLNQVVLNGNFLTTPRKTVFFRKHLVKVKGNTVLLTKRSIQGYIRRIELLQDLKNLRNCFRRKIEKLLEGETVKYLTLKVVNVHCSIVWYFSFPECVSALVRKVRQNHLLRVRECETSQEPHVASFHSFHDFNVSPETLSSGGFLHFKLTFSDPDFPTKKAVLKVFPAKEKAFDKVLKSKKKTFQRTNVTFIFGVFSAVTRELISILEDVPRTVRHDEQQQQHVGRNDKTTFICDASPDASPPNKHSPSVSTSTCTVVSNTWGTAAAAAPGPQSFPPEPSAVNGWSNNTRSHNVVNSNACCSTSRRSTTVTAESTDSQPFFLPPSHDNSPCNIPTTYHNSSATDTNTAGRCDGNVGDNDTSNCFSSSSSFPSSPFFKHGCDEYFDFEEAAFLFQ